VITTHIYGCNAIAGGRCRCRDVLALGLAPKIEIPFVGKVLTPADQHELDQLVRAYVLSRADDMKPAPHAAVYYETRPEGVKLKSVVWVLGEENPTETIES
jgi:hypothetical protein